MTTLKTLVDETTNIKNELIVCCNNLRQNLIDKEVSLDGAEKISNLINKVKDIETVVNVVAGDTTQFVSMVNTYSSSSDIIHFPARVNIYQYKFQLKGSLRVKFTYATSKTSYNIVVQKVKEDGSVDFTKTCSNSNTNYVTHTVDISNIEPTDIIKITCDSSNVNSAVKLRNFYIMGKIIKG